MGCAVASVSRERGSQTVRVGSLTTESEEVQLRIEGFAEFEHSSSTLLVKLLRVHGGCLGAERR